MSDLIREIDEEVSKEKSEQFWQRWALPVGIALAIVIVGLFIFFTIQARRDANALSCADNFEAAITALSDDPLAAQGQFAALTENCGGYNQLAVFKQADALLAQGEDAQAVAAWQAFAADETNQVNLRNLAHARVAWFGNGSIDAAGVQAALDHLSTVPAYSDYLPVMKAVAALEAGDTEGANTLLQSVLDSEEANEDARSYALSVAALMNDL